MQTPSTLISLPGHDPRLITDIDNSERCELLAYLDTKGFWTVGWGHLLDQSIHWNGYEITQAQADQWRDVDIQKAVAGAIRTPEWGYVADSDCRQNAIIELVFNMGLTHWMGFFNTRAAIRARDWQHAHDGLLDSQWAREVKERRANRLANYLLTGVYPIQ